MDESSGDDACDFPAILRPDPLEIHGEVPLDHGEFGAKVR